MLATIEHIERFYASQHETLNLLTQRGEISLANTIEGSLAKMLIVASASYFEQFLTDAISQHCATYSTHVSVAEFCRIGAIEMKYHSWFDWKATNATRFFRMFGDATKDKAALRMRADEPLSDGVTAFMYIGSQRNLIVHRNMLAYALPDTSEEVIAKSRSALRFVNYVADELFTS